MKKYKKITKQDYLDEIYSIVENFNLTDEEKEEVDILINKYSGSLQKINEIINSDKLKKIKQFTANYLNRENDVKNASDT